jgi:hypothetical protein
MKAYSRGWLGMFGWYGSQYLHGLIVSPAFKLLMCGVKEKTFQSSDLKTKFEQYRCCKK